MFSIGDNVIADKCNVKSLRNFQGTIVASQFRPGSGEKEFRVRHKSNTGADLWFTAKELTKC